MQDNIFDNKAMLKDTKAFFDIFTNKFNFINIVEKYILTRVSGNTFYQKTWLVHT